MSGSNGHGRPGNAVAVAAAGPVVLVRYRPGVTGQSARTVHVIPLLTDMRAGAVSALCGVLLRLHDLEMVTAGQGMPCTVCIISHDTGTTLAVEPEASKPASAVATTPIGVATYQAWGWPVSCHRDQTWLSLTHDVVALVIPALLAARVSVILAAWRCLPPVLVHPEAREHWFVLAGERFGLALPWPPGVHHATGAHLLLPPAVTPGGLVTWVAPPLSVALRLCREVDVFAAVRTALRELRPGGPPSGGGLPL